MDHYHIKRVGNGIEVDPKHVIKDKEWTPFHSMLQVEVLSAGANRFMLCGSRISFNSCLHYELSAVYFGGLSTLAISGSAKELSK